jgi:hypothetical protein
VGEYSGPSTRSVDSFSLAQVFLIPADKVGNRVAEFAHCYSKGSHVSLSAISSFSISQRSVFDDPSPTAQTSSISDPESTNGTFVTDALVNDLGTLLRSLASGDVNGAKIALTKIEAFLNGGTTSDLSTSSTGNIPCSQSSDPLSRLDQWTRTPRTTDHGRAKCLTGWLRNRSQGCRESISKIGETTIDLVCSKP